MSEEDRDLVDLPINLPNLEMAVEAARASRSPGLDGLSSEFYRAVLTWVGPAMVDALNTMLEEGLLAPTHCTVH